MADFKYKNDKNQEYIDKRKELLSQLPQFCTTYCNAKNNVKPLTLYCYVQRFHTFFTFLSGKKSYMKGKALTELDYGDMDRIDVEMMDEFIHELSEGQLTTGKRLSANSINNYISALTSLWSFSYKRGKIKANVMEMVIRAKVKKGEIDRKYLKEDDTVSVYNVIASGYGLSDHSQAFRSDVAVARDCAIYITLLHTGLRVSEIVGLDVQHVHLNCDNPFVETLRKENYKEEVFLSDEAREAIAAYLALRDDLRPDKSENALFLSTMGKDKGKRLSVRSVQRLIKKYAEAGAPEVGSHISPHRIRATFATMMIEKTGDLSLVQNMMAHKSPDTTSIYIADRTKARERHRNDIQN